MRKLTLALALLFVSGAYATSPSFEISKDKLSEVRTKLVEQQKSCDQKEAELKADPFLKNIEKEMATAISEGEISSETGKQVLGMINLVVKTIEDVCAKNDEVLEKVEQEMKSGEPTNILHIKKLEDEKYDIVLNNLQKIQDLAVNENVSEDEQELLQIISGVMGRVMQKIEAARAAGNETVIIQ